MADKGKAERMITTPIMMEDGVLLGSTHLGQVHQLIDRKMVSFA
jgi:hypothetical protein